MTSPKRYNIWHRNATNPLDGVPSVQTALRISGLDWETQVRPIAVVQTTPSGESAYAEIPKHFATIRSDTQEVLGLVRSRYTPVHNRTAFQIMDPLVQEGLAEYVSAGMFRGGQDVYVSIRFIINDPRVEDIFGFSSRGDLVRSMGVFTNNNIGVRKATLSMTPIRIACENSFHLITVRAGSEDSGVKIMHGARANSQLVEAARTLWKDIVESHVRVAAQFRALKGAMLDEELFASLVLDVVAPLPQNPASRQYESRLAQMERRRAKLTDLFYKGKGQDGNPTAWAAYNAVTEYLDHYHVVSIDRIRSEVEGGTGLMKRDVYRNLMHEVVV